MIKERKGFSLIELSIVLVILGLLAGGILAGQSLIHASAVRATIAQMTDLDTTVNTFHDKYLGLPGDIKNATDFWPAAANGNGNGTIETSAASCASLPAAPDCGMYDGERSQFYVQLGLAGLTPAYDGTTTLGRGYPSIKLYPTKGMFVSGTWLTGPGSSNMDAQLYATDSTYLYMGVCSPSYFGVSSTHNDCAIFLPEEVWNIDTKLDDGLPLSGKIIGESYNTICVSGGPATAAGSTASMTNNYNLSNTTAACNILYSLH